MTTNSVTLKKSRRLIVGLTMVVLFWDVPVINYSASAQDYSYEALKCIPILDFHEKLACYSAYNRMMPR
jgi:hypothetical protein